MKAPTFEQFSMWFALVCCLLAVLLMVHGMGARTRNEKRERYYMHCLSWPDNGPSLCREEARRRYP